MNLDSHIRNLQAMERRARDPSPVLLFAAKAGESEVKQRISRSLTVFGAPMRPLKHARANSAGGDKPLLDTGMMRSAVRGTRGARSATVTSHAQQSSTHQYGATIRPKRSRFLAIPADTEAKRVGSPRRFKRPLRTIINREGTGGVMIDDSGNRPVVKWFLTTMVRVPARPFVGWSAGLLALIGQRYIEHVRGR